MDLPFYLIWTGLLLIGGFLTFRFFVPRDYQRKGRLTPFSIFLEYLIFFLWSYFTYVDVLSGGLTSSTHPILRAVAWVLSMGGLAVLFVAMAQLGLARLHGLNVDPLEQSRLYRFTRNPQILASMVAVIGYALFWPSWHTLGWVVLFAVLVHLMVRAEEAHLHAVHGEAYEQYCARVPRYLGRVRR